MIKKNCSKIFIALMILFAGCYQYSYKKELQAARDSIKFYTDYNWYKQAPSDTVCPFCTYKLNSVDLLIMEKIRNE
jgi:hypothetical protein